MPQYMNLEFGINAGISSTVTAPLRLIGGEAGSILGESPLWHAGAFYWTDVNGGSIHGLLVDGVIVTRSFNTPVVAITATSHDDLLLVVLGDRIGLWDRVSDRFSTLQHAVVDWPKQRFNDATIDPSGRLWVGRMRNNIGPDGSHVDATDQQGDIICVDMKASMPTGIAALGCPNGLAFALDQEQIFWADSAANCLMTGRVDRLSTAVTNAKEFGDRCDRGIPDGSAVDAQGYLWNARFGGGCIVRFAPDGSIDRVLKLPVTNPTCCCFGDAQSTTLYVTSARLLAPEDEVCAGFVLALDVGITGAPLNVFELGPAQ